MSASGRAFLLIFLVHCGVQGLFLTRVPERGVLPHTRWEVPAVAMALYERGEFADPYCLPTGPTAHMPPFQPALIAAVYHLLGPTLTGGYVLWAIAIGLSFHVTPSLLPVALGLLAFELAWLRQPRRWRWAALTLLGMTLACVPWTVRNHRQLGGLFFIRSNFGLELRMGNHPGAGPTLDLSALGGTERHPLTNEPEARKVQQLGELEYMRQAGREAAAWIRSHPLVFLLLTGLRVAQFWLGTLDDPLLALGTTLMTLVGARGAWRAMPRLSAPQRAAILIPLVTYPLVYYVIGYEARYRQPVDGLALLLAATALGASDLRRRTAA